MILVRWFSLGDFVLQRILVFLLLGMGTVAADTLLDIPADHRIILKEDWKPTPEQTRRALQRMQTYLEHPRKGYRSDPAVMQAVREIYARNEVRKKGQTHT
jgi:hypothetical protein